MANTATMMIDMKGPEYVEAWPASLLKGTGCTTVDINNAILYLKEVITDVAGPAESWVGIVGALTPREAQDVISTVRNLVRMHETQELERRAKTDPAARARLAGQSLGVGGEIWDEDC